MVGNFVRAAALVSCATASLALPLAASRAAGPFDGTREIESPAVSGNAGSTDVSACEGIKIEFKIIDNQLTGNLRRAPYGQARVAASDSGGSPFTGKVQPDGTLTAQWESYHVTGKLAGNKAELKWTGQCGPRTGSGSRIG